LLFSSCYVIPFPHVANVTPLVHGRIEKNGEPAAAVPVRVALGNENDPCGDRHRDTTTNNRGQFAVRPLKTFNFFLYMMAHRNFDWNFCVRANQGWSRVYQSREGYTLVDTGPWWFSRVNCATASDKLSSLQCMEDSDLDVSDEKFEAILRQSQNARRTID